MEREKREALYSQEDEIDLYELFLVLRNRYKLIVSVFVISVAVAVAASFLLPPVYEGSFVVRTSVISPSETEKLIAGLNGLVEEESLKELSVRLGIEEAAAENIVLIEAEAPREKEEHHVEVFIEVMDPLLIHGIKEGLLKYLNDNKFVRERIALKRESIEHLKEEILAKIKKIEKLSDDVIGHIEQGRIKDIGFNPIGLDKGIIDLRHQLKDLDNQLELLRGFEVAVEPVVPREPARPKKLVNVAVAGMGSLFIGVFLVFFMEWAGRNRETNKQ